MKKLIYINGLLLCLLAGNLFSSCDTQALMDMDIPKYMLSEDYADLGMLFSSVEVSYTREAADVALRIPSGFCKYLATHSLIMPGDRYQYDGNYDGLWNFYTSEGKGVIHLLGVLQKNDDPTMTNNIAMLKILKGAIFSWATDLYGDIPYSEAELAYLSGNLNPKFDTQESIYKDILTGIDEACSSFDASKSVWSKYDIIYKGDLVKWKKFGYSLMLRMAMRAAAVDPALGKQYAEKAIAGGVILSNDDNFKITCVNNQVGERNPCGNLMVNMDTEKYWKLGEDFVNALKDNADPRAKVIFGGGKLKEEMPVPNSGIMNTYWWDDEAWEYTISEQKGYPHGLVVQTTTYELIQKEYTRPSRYLFDYASPVVRLAAYEMYFCIAKAAELGWNTGGRSAADMYNEGVKSSAQFYAGYAGTPDITDDEVAAYLASRPYSPDNVIYEMWVSNYLDPFQGWFYVRQWGPDLKPNVQGVSMPRRIPYPSVELTRNEANYKAALQQMGMPADVTNEGQLTYRCWWDVRR